MKKVKNEKYLPSPFNMESIIINVLPLNNTLLLNSCNYDKIQIHNGFSTWRCRADRYRALFYDSYMFYSINFSNSSMCCSPGDGPETGSGFSGCQQLSFYSGPVFLS